MCDARSSRATISELTVPWSVKVGGLPHRVRQLPGRTTMLSDSDQHPERTHKLKPESTAMYPLRISARSAVKNQSGYMPCHSRREKAAAKIRNSSLLTPRARFEVNGAKVSLMRHMSAGNIAKNSPGEGGARCSKKEPSRQFRLTLHKTGNRG